jgi:protein-tyrosine phosphatase
MKIAFVCTGNICRSPMAESVMKYKAQRAGLDLEVGSFGTHAYHVGETADPRTLHILQERRIEEPSRAKQIVADDIDSWDHFFAMDHKHLADLLAIGVPTEKCSLFLSWDENPRTDHVPDPYYGDLSDFEHVFDVIDRGVNSVISAIQDGRLSAV